MTFRYRLSRLRALGILVLRELAGLMWGYRSPACPPCVGPKGPSTSRLESSAWGDLRKLHLGAGSVYLNGYVNTDMPVGSLAEAEGRRVDARCYLHDLSQFSDRSFDVVELYHVIEHVTPDHARQATQEMFRVLDTGGEVVIECPNLAKCALNYLKDPSVVKIGMDGIYSDSQWHHEESMVHRWGYDSAGLYELLLAGGFTPELVFEIPARRYPQRDLRMVAFKGAIEPSQALLRARERATRDSVTLWAEPLVSS